MHCPSCARSNRPGARFCGGCGASLAPRCAACGASNDPDARFCDACGAALGAAPSEKAIARKVVTVVFADLIGSVSLHERLDAESARRVIDRYHRAMTAAVEVHGGKVIQLLGDGVLAAFGVPRVAEDDAIRAVRAGAGMQRAFRELVREQGAAMEAVGLRVAVNTGEVVVSDDETAVIGDPTNVAARLQQEARDGDVLLGENTQRLVGELVTLAPLGSFALRGRSESVAAFRLVSLERPASARATAFVGRDEELRRLLSVYDAAVAAPAARLAVLLGSPGLGKSRLVAETLRRAGARATVLAARCDAAGGATFAPIADALRAFLRIEEGAGGDVLRAAIDAVVPGDDAERARIAAGIGALFSGAPSSPEETFFAVRRLLAALAAVRPVVLAIDDLHWAEPLLLDLVEHLVTWSAGVRLFLLVAARPELRDARSSLATPGPLVADVVTLGGLDAGASMQLAAGVVGASELPAALVGRVLATSEGNPLFLSELVRMLVQDGTLAREGDRWVTTVEVSKLDMPPTIQVLLGARIERLRPEDRTVLERAAVIGRHFSRSAVAELLGRGGGDLDARLESLRRSELIEPDTGWFLGEPALRFHHVLIRDAAYRRVLKETRAELHERVADWVVARSGESSEHDETIGWHLEQAHQNLRELGALDAHGRGLGERAARHLGAAGRRALARDDLALAASLLGRAIERLERDDPARADLALDWCEALLAAGEVGAAAGAVAELGRLAAGSERLGAWHACFAGQLAALTDPQSLRATAGEVARAASALAAADDAAGEAKAHSVHAAALARLGEIGACETALDHALAAARRARDRRRSNAVLAGAPVAALWGPSAVTRASGRCLDVVRVLRITQGAPAVEAVALRCQAVLETLRGRADAARRMIAASRAMVEELGIAQQMLEADVFAGLIDLLEGDAEAAERSLRRAYEGLRERGLRIDAARAAALLARALLAQERGAEAETLSHESEALGGDDLKAAIAWRGVRAEALARRGETAEAVELARAAVAIASATDALLDHADARLALAISLRAAGRAAEADAEEARARELWEAKGATLLAERMRRAEGAATAPNASSREGESAAVSRRVRPNAATANIARLDAAMAARDLAEVESLFSAFVEAHHHPLRTRHGREGAIRSLRMMLANRDLVFRNEPIASLGDRLALCRQRMSSGGVAGGDVDVGAIEAEHVWMIEVDAEGRRVRAECFAATELAAALGRLYQRHADLLPPGPERDRAQATAQAFDLGSLEPEAVVGRVTPDVVLVDHRTAGLPPLRGPEALARALGAAFELAADAADRLEDVLAVAPHGLLTRWTTVGRVRDGGPFEWPLLMLVLFGPDGRTERIEVFEVGAHQAALARFDELGGAASGAHRAAPSAESASGREQAFAANAATRSEDAMIAAWRAHDWNAVCATFAPGFRSIDRRSLMHVETDLDGLLASFRPIFDMEIARESTLLATRGERLALYRTRIVGSDELAGPSEVELLQVIEADAAGRRIAAVAFDAGDLAAAYAELDARSAEGAAGRTTPAVSTSAARAWERFCEAWRAGAIADLAALLAPDFRHFDRRAIFATELDREGFLAGFAPLLAANSRSRSTYEILALRGDRLVLGHIVDRVDRLEGAEEFGPFEVESLIVGELDETGRLATSIAFDPGHRDAAYAELDARWAAGEGAQSREPGANDPVARWLVPNAAVAAHDRLVAAFDARDWEAMRAAFAPEARIEDRRAGLRTPPIDRDTAVASLREGARFVAPDLRTVRSLFAVFGDRVSLERQTWRGGPAEGRFEMEMLSLTEADPEGRVVAVVSFDPGDVDEACRAATERWIAIEPQLAPLLRASLAYRDATRNRDVAALRALLADDLVVEDRRRTGFRRLAGGDALVESFRAAWQLTQESMSVVRARPAVEPWGSVLISHATGTRADGGAVEGVSGALVVFEAGRFRRLEFFELDGMEAALARFEELAPRDAGAAPLAPWIQSNAAAATRERIEAALAAGDEAALRSCFRPDARGADRRRSPRGELVGASAIETMRTRFARSGELRSERRIVGVFGARLALEQQRWHPASDRATAGLEVLTLFEVDCDGRLAAIHDFDPDDVPTAIREAQAHGMVVEPESAPVLGPILAYIDAFERRDAVALRERITDDVVAHDHRRTGAGTLEGADAFLAFVRANWNLTTEAALLSEAGLAYSPRAMVGMTRLAGRLLDGGPFEIRMCTLIVVEGDRLRRIEMFEASEVGPALARFEALCAGSTRPDPLRIPVNAAVRAGERGRELAIAGDWEGLRAHCAPEYRFEDRRRLLRNQGDRDMLVANSRRIGRAAWERASRTLLATHGDRLCLHRTRFEGPRAGAEFLVESLEVTEVDERGRLLAGVIFDAEDRRAAAVEMLERYMRGEGARTMPAAQIAFLRAMQAHDLAGMRAALDDAFTFVDHRRIGLGRLGNADDYVASVAALMEQSADFATDVLYHVAIAEHGSLSVGRMFGTLREGGPFESVFVRLNRYEDGRNVGAELFEIEDLERAKARFEALGREHAAQRRDSSPAPANAATRAMQRFVERIQARDWGVLEAMLAPAFQYEDRSRGLRDDGGRAKLLASLRIARASDGTMRIETLATAGERLTLQHLRLVMTDAERILQEIELLRLAEIDAQGRLVAMVMFDPTARRAADEELRARFARGEGARAETPRGRQERLATLGDSLALVRVTHSASDDRGQRVDVAAFERSEIVLGESTADGRARREERFAGDRLGDAVVRLYERYAELAPDGPERERAAATARIVATALGPMDPDRYESMLAPDTEAVDHRNVGPGSARGREEVARGFRALFDLADRFETGADGVLALHPDAMLVRMVNTGTLRDGGGSYERRFLLLLRFGPDGLVTRSEIFDVDREEEAIARFDALGGAAVVPARNAAYSIWELVTSAMTTRNWDALRALAAPDFVFEDRRRFALVQGDIETYVRNLAFVREWPGRRVAPELLATAGDRLALDRVTFVADPDGGVFSGDFVRITELDADGRLRAVLHFDEQDLGAARAEMHERHARSAADSDPLRIPPNAATRAMDRFAEAALARDWDAFAAILAPAFTFEDRRRGIGMSGDRATMLASIRLVAASGVRWAGEVIATAGDRLALTRNRFWTADGATLLSEIETLQIAEVDADGLVVAHVVFDASDLRAANLELVERYASSDPDESRRASRLAMARAMRDHDLDGIRAALREGFVYHDHRRVGAGRLEGEEYVAWLAALFEQSPDAVIAPLYVIASEPHAVLSLGHTFGTRVEGGAFESVFVQISGASGIELYDLDDLDRARARFDELAGKRT